MDTEAKGFDTKKFSKTEYSPREGAVSIPALCDYFGDNEKPEWIVRGLTHAEIAKGVEAYERRKKTGAILEFLTADTAQIRDAIAEVMGTNENVPMDTARRLEHLVIASVKPEIDIGIAVKFAKAFPIQFTEVTNRIYELSTLGMEAKKKPSNSGVTPISKTA